MQCTTYAQRQAACTWLCGAPLLRTSLLQHVHVNGGSGTTAHRAESQVQGQHALREDGPRDDGHVHPLGQAEGQIQAVQKQACAQSELRALRQVMGCIRKHKPAHKSVG